MTQEKTVVNLWNEWDPLKHIIVGRTDGCTVQQQMFFGKGDVKIIFPYK